MNGSVQGRLRAFSRDLLERRGALVEWPDGADDGLALLPDDLTRSLGLPASARLSHTPEGQGLFPNLATDFLERVFPLVDAEPTVYQLAVPDLYVKRSEMSAPVARAFSWLNARVRVIDAKPVETEYHCWYFGAELASEDRLEEVLRVDSNPRSGAALELEDFLERHDLVAAELPATALEGSYRVAVRHAARRVEERSRDFIARLERRLGRDRQRLEEYYGALMKDEQRKASRDPDEKARERREASRRAVDLELRRKLAELEDRYTLEVRLTPLAMVRLVLPALEVQLDVHRRRARSRHLLFWNSLNKELEPMACGACGRSTFEVAFTDDDVEPRCTRCIIGDQSSRTKTEQARAASRDAAS